MTWISSRERRGRLETIFSISASKGSVRISSPLPKGLYSTYVLTAAKVEQRLLPNHWATGRYPGRMGEATVCVVHPNPYTLLSHTRMETDSKSVPIGPYILR
jgi:hypothetical protein